MSCDIKKTLENLTLLDRCLFPEDLVKNINLGECRILPLFKILNNGGGIIQLYQHAQNMVDSHEKTETIKGLEKIATKFLYDPDNLDVYEKSLKLVDEHLASVSDEEFLINYNEAENKNE